MIPEVLLGFHLCWNNNHQKQRSIQLHFLDLQGEDPFISSEFTPLDATLEGTRQRLGLLSWESKAVAGFR